MRNRRREENYRLRTYIDAIKAAKAMTDEDWINQYVFNPFNDKYICRLEWISYLNECILEEADRLTKAA